MKNEFPALQKFNEAVHTGLIEAFRTAIKVGELEIAKLNPEALKDKETKKEFLMLMGLMEKAQNTIDAMTEDREEMNETEKDPEKASIGFTAALKKAA